MPAKPQYQILKIDTLVGPKDLRAPAGWDFDETAIHVWSALLAETRRSPILARDKHAQRWACDLLGNILANTLGMASFYWTEAAKTLTKG